MSVRSNSPIPLVSTGSKGVMSWSFGGHRRSRVLALPAFEQPVEVRGRHVVMVLQIVLQARRLVACREAFDLFVGDEAVVGGAAVGDAESRADVRAQLIGAAEHARERPTDLDDVFADGPLEQQRIERCDRLDLAARESGQRGGVVERRGGHIAVLVLAVLQERDERALRVVVLRDERAPACFALRRHRSTSPNTGSKLPMMATTSAMRLPGASFLRACRLYKEGGRQRTRQGLLPPA